MTKKIKKLTQVIFNQDGLFKVKNIGKLINVKSGYARNYLIPKQLAKLATISRIKEFELNRKKLYLKELKKIEIAKENQIVLERIKNFTIQKRATNNKKMFGSINNKEIIDLVREKSNLELQNIEILPFVIKEVGVYNIQILLHPTIIVTIELKVIAQ